MNRKIYTYGGLIVLSIVALFFLVLFLGYNFSGLISGELVLINAQLYFAKKLFPHWYYQLIYFSLLVEFIGAVTLLYIVFRMLIWLKRQLPKYSDFKKEYLRFVLVVFVISIFVFGFAGAEYALRLSSPINSLLFLGCRLSPAETWNQKDTADERGMNYAKPNYDWGDTLRHINKQGFLANWNYDKETIDSFKMAGYKIVFVIGDSYTEGVTSSTWDKTFCELTRKELIRQKYLICNLGVGGTDVLQYRLVAEKYIPELKPDIVIVGFCGCNDFIMFDRLVTPNVPLCYQTNIGYMNSNIGCNQIICPTADSLYKFYQKISPGNQHSFLITYFLSHLYGWKEPIFENRYSDTSTATFRNLAEVRSVAQNNGAKFLIAFIPDVKRPTLHSEEEADSLYGKLFMDLRDNVRFYLKGDITYLDYINPETIPHFNDNGNRKFAYFFEEVILSDSADR